MAKHDAARNKGTTQRPIVSSAHLAAGGSPALSEVEFSLTLAVTAYHRWMVHCMTASGMSQLSPLEVLILHTVRHRDRPKSMADIALVLDIEETHLATYAVRKLTGAGLVTTVRQGKEKLVTATEDGIALCDRYAALREKLLVSAVGASGATEEQLSTAAALLRTLSGFYHQAARSAATL
jgi:predicted MarR family transcription regulator